VIIWGRVGCMIGLCGVGSYLEHMEVPLNSDKYDDLQKLSDKECYCNPNSFAKCAPCTADEYLNEIDKIINYAWNLLILEKECEHCGTINDAHHSASCPKIKDA